MNKLLIIGGALLAGAALLMLRRKPPPLPEGPTPGIPSPELPDVVKPLTEPVDLPGQQELADAWGLHYLDAGMYMVSFMNDPLNEGWHQLNTEFVMAIAAAVGMTYTPPALPEPDQPPEPETDQYKVDVQIQIQPVCLTNQGSVCLEWSPIERYIYITVTNKGEPGRFKITHTGVMIWTATWSPDEQSGDIHSVWAPATSWFTDFAAGQSQLYSRYYVLPLTGMPLTVFHLITVYDPDNNIIFNRYLV